MIFQSGTITPKSLAPLDRNSQIQLHERPPGGMKYVLVDESWEDYLYWQKTYKRMLKWVNQLLEDIARHPFEGIGKTLLKKY